MEKETKQKEWKPATAYLKSVTLKAAVRENIHYVDRETIETHWKKANNQEKKDSK